MFFSVVIPVYNRPAEIRELLNSLTDQVFIDFEVIIVEDGSSVPCKSVISTFESLLDIRYYYQPNQGQGFARNFGMNRAKGAYFVLFDSDCIVPPHYLQCLYDAIRIRKLDAHGGPDAAREDFSVLQKAINFSMTSWLTTGGIRGKMNQLNNYQARGYNMGFSREVFTNTQGFVDANKGEDIELSIRIKKLGYKLELVKDAFVYHKRKNSFVSFFEQSFSFGRNRVNVSRYHKGSIKMVHFLPMGFLLAWIAWIACAGIDQRVKYLGSLLFGLWTLMVLISSSYLNRSLLVGLYSVLTSYGQLFSYGFGLLWELVRKSRKGG
jgi:glycosyltransferase involved in cell wall biosynthesis